MHPLKPNNKQVHVRGLQCMLPALVWTERRSAENAACQREKKKSIKTAMIYLKKYFSYQLQQKKKDFSNRPDVDVTSLLLIEYFWSCTRRLTGFLSVK